MAPEQHIGGATDARTDQFSFCVSLHEALYGYRPFAGTTLPELRESVLAGKVEPEPRYTEIPPQIRRALLRGLEADPNKRFPDLESLLREIEPPRPAAGRWRFAAAGAVVLVAAAVATMWWNATVDAEVVREGERLRGAFEQTRIVNAEEELRRIRHRTVSERWDDLVLTYAEEKVAQEPTLAIAALKHLTPGNAGWLAAARTIAADASRRGPVHREREDLGTLVRLEFVGDRLLARGGDGRMHVWDLGSDTLETHAPPPGVTINAFTLDGREAVRAAGADGKLYRIGDASEPIVVSTLPLHAIAAGGDRIAVGDAAGDVWLVAADDTIERKLRRHRAPVRALAFHPDDPSRLASGGEDDVVWVSFLDRQTHWTLEHNRPSYRLHWAYGGSALLSIDHTGDVDGWDDEGRSIEMSDYPDAVEDVAFDALGTVEIHHDGRTISASIDAAVPLELHQREGAVSSIAASADGHWIAAAKGDVLQLWHTGPDARGRRALGEVPIETDDGAIAAMATLAGGDLLTASRHGNFRRWIAEGESTLLADTGLEVARLVVAPDGRRVAIEDAVGAVHVLDLADASGFTTLGRVRAHRPGPLAWAPDGSAVAKLGCANTPTCLLAIHPADGGVPRPLGDVPGEGRSLRYSADGTHLVSEHATGVFLWDLQTGDGRRIEAGDPNDHDLELIAYAFVDGDASLRTAGRPRARSTGVSSLRVWQTRVDDTRVHELFVQDELSQLVASDDRDALLVQTADDRVLVWFLYEDRFVLLPDRLLPERESVTRLRVAPGRDAILLDIDGGRRSVLVDLASGQRRTLPALIDPVAWADDGMVVDVVGNSRIRRWVDPTPDDPSAFLTWLDGVTTIRIEASDLH
jgi:WD40 repeat protein